MTPKANLSPTIVTLEGLTLGALPSIIAFEARSTSELWIEYAVWVEVPSEYENSMISLPFTQHACPAYVPEWDTLYFSSQVPKLRLFLVLNSHFSKEFAIDFRERTYLGGIAHEWGKKAGKGGGKCRMSIGKVRNKQGRGFRSKFYLRWGFGNDLRVKNYWNLWIEMYILNWKERIHILKNWKGMQRQCYKWILIKMRCFM